jgi:DNA modification methylase
MAPRALSIEYVSVASLQLDPKNPRLHSRKQIRQLAMSIRTFGFNAPVLVDAQLRVIAGHGRVLASKLLKLTQIPAIRLEHLSESQIRAFMIADNKLTENSEWDDRLLGEQFKILSEAEIDFSLEVTGFETSEIDIVVEGLAPAGSGDNDPADEMPGEEGKTQVTRAGDLWILDRHRIYCGDARDPAAYSLLMQCNRATAVFADPPYNCPIDRYVANFGRIHHDEFAMASGEMSKEQFTAFLSEAFRLAARHSANGSLHFIFIDWRHATELLAAANDLYTEFKNLCVWVKDVAGQGSFYRSQHELVFVFKSGKSSHRNNIQLGQFGRYRTNVWQYRRVVGLSRNTDEGNLSELHPTVKPVQLVADAILDCTARGDIVLDPFLGSGTTVIAAQRCGRVCYGMEINPGYIDTTIRRWQRFTGEIAVNESSGRAFNEIEQEMTNG